MIEKKKLTISKKCNWSFGLKKVQNRYSSDRYYFKNLMHFIYTVLISDFACIIIPKVTEKDNVLVLCAIGGNCDRLASLLGLPQTKNIRISLCKTTSSRKYFGKIVVVVN